MRLSIALLTIAVSISTATIAKAGCLTDWLRGRTGYASQYAPYAVGYAPPVAGQAPIVATSPQVVGYAPAPTVVQAAPVPTGSTSMLRPVVGPPPVTTSGAYQLQRPTYYDNPSVYTGMPVASNLQSTYRAPLTTLRGTGPSSTYLGSANQYPTTYSSGYGYASNYAAAQTPVTSPPVTSPGLPAPVASPTGLPASSLPATVAPPLYPARQPAPGGLARFFGSLFDTNYRTSYYRAPVTYYRPVTTVDPVTGQPITVQQPCTSYAQQLQRTPYRSLQPAPVSSQPLPATCQSAPTTLPYGTTSVSPPSGFGQGFGQGSAIGQVSAIGQGSGNQGSGNGVVPAGGIGSFGTTGPAPSYGGSTVMGGATVNPPSTTQPSLTQPSLTQPSLTQPSLTQPSLTQPSFSTPGTSLGGRSLPPQSAPAPLTGRPPSRSPANGSGDMAPVDQPRLENYPPAESSNQDDATITPPSNSYWKLQDAEDSSAFLKRKSEQRIRTDQENLSDPVSLQADRGAAVEPIEAPADYVAPFSSRTMQPGPIGTAKMKASEVGDRATLPELPRPSIEPAQMTSVTDRLRTPIREAGMIRTRAARPQGSIPPEPKMGSQRPAAPIKRDTAWYTIQP